MYKTEIDKEVERQLKAVTRDRARLKHHIEKAKKLKKKVGKKKKKKKKTNTYKALEKALSKKRIQVRKVQIRKQIKLKKASMFEKINTSNNF